MSKSAIIFQKSHNLNYMCGKLEESNMNVFAAFMIFLTSWYYIPLESPTNPVEIYKGQFLNLKNSNSQCHFFPFRMERSDFTRFLTVKYLNQYGWNKNRKFPTKKLIGTFIRYQKFQPSF